MEVRSTGIDLWPTRVTFFETPVDWAVNRQLADEAIAATQGQATGAIVMLAGLCGFDLCGSEPAALRCGYFFLQFYFPHFFPQRIADYTVVQRMKPNKYKI